MSTDNALLEFEGGQNAFPMTKLTDSGDGQTFQSGEELWSQASGVEPVIRPDGVINGADITPAGTEDAVSVAAFMANVSGEEISVSANPSLSLTRADVSNTHMVNSIVCDSSGDVTVVSGAAGKSFSEARGENGGPAYVPVGSIEIGQVRLSATAPAAIKEAEIFQLVNRHQERADFPVPNVDYINGNVEFSSPPQTSHTGDKAKGVYARFSTPEFIEAIDAYDFVPSEVSFSSSSKQTYTRVKNTRSQSLGNASFSIDLKDGITDTLTARQGQNIYFRFYPDKFKPQHIIEQGALSMSRSYPAGGDVVASCTINVDEKGKEVAL